MRTHATHPGPDPWPRSFRLRIEFESLVECRTAVPPTSHIAVNGTLSKLGKVRTSAIDEQTTRSTQDCAISRRCRKRIAEIFGWIKTAAGYASAKVRGKPRAAATFTLAVAACNLIRIPKLLARPAT